MTRFDGNPALASRRVSEWFIDRFHCSAGGMAQLGSVKKPAAQAVSSQGPAPALPPPKLGAWGKGAPVGAVL